MRFIVPAALVLAGLIHLLPVPGLLGGERLQALYGLDFSDPNLAILMRHRAVLFGLLGTYLVGAAFRPAWRTTALVAGLASVLAFLGLAAAAENYHASLARIVLADQVALAALLLAAAVQAWSRRGRRDIGA